MPKYPKRFDVRRVKNAHVVMSDGATIATDLTLPDAEGRFPVVLEYLPYRKDDIMAYRQQRHVYFAERGFACAWVDIRGTGASAGVATDEYPPQEQRDACEIIAWLADQCWSNGNVGMTGISWGGFNAIQVAMLRPPALKAIIPAYATDDRYTDDVHYYGGALRCYELLEYPLQMVGMNVLPPHQEVVGAGWARLWEEHLAAEPWILTWLEQQVDGPYWRHGSLRPDYQSIEAATLMICGWADGYRNWPLRTYAALQCPKRAIIGPWGHEWPNVAHPGPQIDYLAECVAWFDQWLGGAGPEAVQPAPIAVYMQDSRPPAPQLERAPGHWRALTDWPEPGSTLATLYLSDRILQPEPALIAGTADLAYRATVGTRAPADAYGGAGAGLFPVDQRPDEAFSLVYTTAPLDTELSLLGYPALIVHASSSAEIAFFSAKLCDVAPDGASTLITRGFLNATRRDSLSDPIPLTPGVIYELRIELDCCAWVVTAGHHVRLAIAGGDWPNIWPAPLDAVHSIHVGPDRRSRLELPVAAAETPPAPTFGPPEDLVTLSPQDGRGGTFTFVEEYHRQTVTTHCESGVWRATMPEDASVLDTSWEWDLTASNVHPARASAHGVVTYALTYTGCATVVTATVDVASDRMAFQIVVGLSITVNGAIFQQRHWTRSIPRRLL